MGIQHSRPQQPNIFNPIAAGYTRTDSQSGNITWTNTTTGQQLEEYQFVFSNQRQFQYELDAFNFRHNSPVLVSAQYLRKQIQNEICGSFYSGDLFLEAIPLRLSGFKQIPFPDVLHLYSQAFRGFDLIRKQVGAFEITEDLIAVNNSGIVKVWVNADFLKSHPERSIEVLRITQQAMVRRIIQIVNQNTYISPSLNNIANIRQFFQQRNPSTLSAAHSVLEQYAALNNFSITSRLDCFLEVFKNKTTRTQQTIIQPQTQIINQTTNHTVTTPLANQINISRPSTIYRNEPQRVISSISPTHLTHAMTPTQKIIANSIVSKPIITEQPIVSNIPVSNGRSTVPTRVASRYISHNPVASTVQRSSNLNIVPERMPHLNLANNNNISSPIVNNSNLLRYTSLNNSKPLIGAVSPTNYGRVTQINQEGSNFFNKQTININNQRSKTSNPRIINTNPTNNSTPLTINPTNIRKQNITSTNFVVSHNQNLKPSTADNTTQVYQETGRLSGGIFERIQKLNGKYQNQSVQSSQTNNFSRLTNSNNYQTNIAPLINTNKNNFGHSQNVGTAFQNPINNTNSSFGISSNQKQIDDVGGRYLNQQVSSTIPSKETNGLFYKQSSQFSLEGLTSNANNYNLQFVRTPTQNINLASGYIQNSYVPLEVRNQFDTGYLSNNFAYQAVPDIRYTQIREELYENSPQPNSSYGYTTTTYTQNYQIGTNQGVVSQSNYFESSVPSGMAYLTQNIQSINPSSSYQRDYYFKQEYSSTFQHNNISQNTQDLISNVQQVSVEFQDN